MAQPAVAVADSGTFQCEDGFLVPMLPPISWGLRASYSSLLNQCGRDTSREQTRATGLLHLQADWITERCVPGGGARAAEVLKGTQRLGAELFTTFWGRGFDSV